jgi:hypothetical protein
MQKKRKPLQRLHTEVLLRMVLQDAQTRLVFRAQAMLAQEVEYYVPKDGDLNYPDKLGEGESTIPVRRHECMERQWKWGHIGWLGKMWGALCGSG